MHNNHTKIHCTETFYHRTAA